MCGINGYIQYKPKLKHEEISSLIYIMNNKIAHRGPDDEGTFIHDHLGLGMQRLAIIDLNTGKQPLFNEDKSLVIVMNGEIYNYKGLKEDLLSKGHIFVTQSDTEVVLHSFEEYGYDCFNMFNGMFALAIYDLKRNQLVLARDRAGEKPLYYHRAPDYFLFASELKSIVSTRLISKTIDIRALNQFLQLTYIPAPLTIFEDVFKLLPGHYMVIDQANNLNIKQYWDINYSEQNLIKDYDHCKKLLRETLFNAVEECLVADVPVGAFLSGGIDTTIIVGIMSHLTGKPVNTFTAGYRDKAHDETYKAQVVSNLNNTNHHHFYLDYEVALPELSKIISNIDEPFADSSQIPTYMVSQFASQYVKAILTGDAGDELFGGYSRYLIGYYSKLYNRMPKWFRENFIEQIIHAWPDRKYTMQKAWKVIYNANKTPCEQHLNLMSLGFKKDELRYLLNEKWIDLESTEIFKDYYYKYAGTKDDLIPAFYTDFKVTLEGDMLPKVDRASMLCSLETRTPMLHKDIIELAYRIPTEYKINSNKTKIILKDTFKDLLPPELLAFKKKGFSLPIETWLREELKNDLLAELCQERIEEQGIFNYNYIKQYLDAHLAQKRNFYSELWALYIFQKWYDSYYCFNKCN